MFVRASALVLAIAIASCAATPAAATSSQCNTGAIQCCSETLPASQENVQSLRSLGISGPIEGLIGLECTPITMIETGSGANCEQQPVCCTNVDQDGLVNLGCSPIDLNA